MTARVDGREIFCALGATAHRKTGRIEQAFERVPVRAGAGGAPPFQLPLPAAMRAAAAKVVRNIEMRSAPPRAGATARTRTSPSGPGCRAARPPRR